VFRTAQLGSSLCNWEHRGVPRHAILATVPFRGTVTSGPGVPTHSTFESAFTHAPIGMALVDVTGQVLRVNDALCRITGHTADQLCSRSLRDLSDPHDIDVDAAQMMELRAGPIQRYQVEKRYQHAWGHPVWVLLSVSLVRDGTGQPLHFIAQVQDISERKQLEGRLEHLVDHDFLTSLFNGRHFEHRLAAELKSAARYGGGGAVLLLDLDHFKAVNDQFGHKAGDDLLKTVSAALRGRIRETDILARLGGDEFGIILPQVDAEQAQVVAEEMVNALRRQTAMLADHRIAVTASVGIALFDGLTDVEILAAADLAMYEAKEAGRDRVAIYRPLADGPPRVSARLAEAERIQRALTQDQFVLYCQPILDLATNKVSQYELLLRLRTDDGTLLSPGAFLYVAERFGTILAIDAWVVQQAIALIATQAQAGRPLTVNVNLSAKSIGDSHLVAVVDRALADTRIDPACLVFELTETAAIGNIDHAKKFMMELMSRGCRFALDDFGSGFGSFYYLKHLPFDYFKVDGDFIRGFGANTTDQLVVEAIVGIARGMGKKTVAEFVTDQAMSDRLRGSGIDYAQGFHIGMPRPIVEAFAQE
jgi:diguanylate cyclase (GGDEF)-like protein/PAS domain S-box-containing protein